MKCRYVTCTSMLGSLQASVVSRAATLSCGWPSERPTALTYATATSAIQ